MINFFISVFNTPLALITYYTLHFISEIAYLLSGAANANLLSVSCALMPC